MTYEEFIQSIRESRENKWFEYSERHHIIPRCLGGTDDEENLIYLTYREHFIAHKLLADEHPENRDLITTINLMSGLRRYECTPEEYEEAKRKFIDSQRGNKHFEGKEHTEEWKSKCSKWMAGRKQVLGRKWVHKDCDSRMVCEDDLEDYLSRGYQLGRGNFHSKESKEFCRSVSVGRIWINNGTTSKMIYEIEGIPSGWRRGRLLTKGERGRIISVKI